jgi:acetoin utilization deacetylase AcuC-like enzyme
MIQVVYSKKQVADPGLQPIAAQGYTPSPSARKPLELAERLRGHCQFIEPQRLSLDDLKLCHDPDYVDEVMSLRRPNGFGTISQSLVESLPYTNGAMYTAAKLATADDFTCALASGFHHAGYSGWEGLGWFCTFNGLMVTAAKLLAEGAKRIAIIDCDMHYGNGTDDILRAVPGLQESVLHISFGQYFTSPSDSAEYLDWLSLDGVVYDRLDAFDPDLILYQAGADAHVDDPYGGVLTSEQLYRRDLLMFGVASALRIPLAWNLAGGYQVEDGSIDKVLNLHLATFRAYERMRSARWIGPFTIHEIL